MSEAAEPLSPAPEAPASPEPAPPSAPAAPPAVPEEGLEGDPPPAAPAEVTPPEPGGADSESASGIDPSSYEFTFPDTFTPDEVFLTDARKEMAAAGVPKDKAQGLVDLYINARTAENTAAEAAFIAQNTEWMAELDAHPDFIPGPTRDKALALVGRVFDEHGKEAREAFQNPAIGNNPAVAKFMLSIAKALSEGEPSPAGRPAPTGKDGKPTPKGFNLSYPNTPEITGN